jgi:SPP1 family phage portal protein
MEGDGMLNKNVPNIIIGDVTPKYLESAITAHKEYVNRYVRLEDYYYGKHDILKRVLTDGKCNNKTVNNFCKYITDTKTGYFLGVPASVEVEDENYSDALYDVLNFNYADDVNSDLATLASIYGHCFELVYLDEDKQICFTPIKPTQLIGLYDGTVKNELVGAVRYEVAGGGVLGADKYYIEVYLSDVVLYFEGRLESLLLTHQEVNYFGKLNIVEYCNNSSKLGDYEGIISLQDAYNLTVADAINEVNYFSEAYLVVKNMVVTEDSIKDMKNNRIIELDENGEASFLTKQLNDGHVQNVLDRLKQDIHKFSNCPALDDEDFGGNVSGVAMKFKLFGLETSTITKERKFTSAIMDRIELITTMLNIMGASAFDAGTVSLQFTRNITQNITEIVDMIQKLKGTVSEETLLSLLPFISDVQEELDKLSAEQEANQIQYDFNNAPNGEEVI